jgi:hypothetical protein
MLISIPCRPPGSSQPNKAHKALKAPKAANSPKRIYPAISPPRDSLWLWVHNCAYTIPILQYYLKIEKSFSGFFLCFPKKLSEIRYFRRRSPVVENGQKSFVVFLPFVP